MGFPGDNELVLNKIMAKTWLIQRLQKPYQCELKGQKFDNPFSFGGGLKNGGLSDEAMDLIRGIFSFDYMGSSEFEWGAVPQALKFLAKIASQNGLINSEVEVGKNETVYYITPLEYKDETINRIKQLRKDESPFRLQERCGLCDYFDPNYKWRKDVVGWLELNNGFMFFVDKTMFTNTCKLFGLCLPNEG